MTTPILATFFGVEYLIAYAVLAAVSIGAGMLLRKKTSTGTTDQQADQPTNQTVRGGFVPVVMGRRRVGCVFLWTGDRTEIEEVVGRAPSGGKSFGGGGSVDIKQVAYFERGWIGLCCQRCLIVNGIYKDGRLVENSRFAKPFMPAGSRIDFGKDGSGFIFWGLDHPGVDHEAMVLLNDLTGIQSKWEGMAWMFWDSVRLGPVARWGNMEYDITAAPPSNVIGFTAPSLIGTDPDAGWNPALCIIILLMEQAPIGCAIPNCRVDFASFSAVGNTLSIEGIAANILIQDGQTAENVIGGILEDIGGMLYEVNGKIGIRLVRTVASPTPIDDSVMLPPYEEIDRFHRVTQADQVVFTYANQNRDFAGDIVNIEDDGASETGTRRRQRRVALTIATTEAVAWKIANRRIQENFAPFAKYGIKFMRDFKAMLPGDVVRHPVLGDLRLIETRFDATSATTDAQFVQDVYGQGATYTDPDDGSSSGGGTTEPPLPDLLFRVLEIPRLSLMQANYTGTVPAYAMLRIRKRNSVSRATLYRGQNTLTLAEVTSTTRRQFGGYLVNSILDDSPYSADGIVIDIFGAGFSALTEADKRKHAVDMAAWVPVTASNTVYAGGITVVIGQLGSEEICYATIIEPEASATLDGKQSLTVKWRIKGLIRSRMTSKIRRHAAGVAVFAFQSSSSNQSPLTVTGNIAPNLPAYHKDRTANANGQEITLSSSTNSTITVEGKWYKAVPVQFMSIGEKIPNHPITITTTSVPSYDFNYPERRPCQRLSSYAVFPYATYGTYNSEGFVRAAICWQMTYPSSTYPLGAGGTAYADGASGLTVGAAEGVETEDRFVLEVCFVPMVIETSTRAVNPIIVRTQIVADASSADFNGEGQNHARFIGVVSIDYSASMHDEDRQAVRDWINQNPTHSINRAATAQDNLNLLSLSSDSKPFIGDRGDETGNPPIFYLRVAHYLLNAPNGIPESVRYYYSYDLDLHFESRLPIYDPNNGNGSNWHYSDYAVAGVNGELF